MSPVPARQRAVRGVALAVVVLAALGAWAGVLAVVRAVAGPEAAGEVALAAVAMAVLATLGARWSRSGCRRGCEVGFTQAMLQHRLGYIEGYFSAHEELSHLIAEGIVDGDGTLTAEELVSRVHRAVQVRLVTDSHFEDVPSEIVRSYVEGDPPG